MFASDQIVHLNERSHWVRRWLGTPWVGCHPGRPVEPPASEGEGWGVSHTKSASASQVRDHEVELVDRNHLSFGQIGARSGFGDMFFPSKSRCRFLKLPMQVGCGCPSAWSLRSTPQETTLCLGEEMMEET